MLIPRILNRLLVLVQGQEIVPEEEEEEEASETRIAVLEDGLPYGYSKSFKSLIVESDNPEIKKWVKESANRLGKTTRYFRVDPTDDGITRIILACPAGGNTDCLRVWSEDRHVIEEHKGVYQKFKKLLKKVPPMPYVTIVGFNLKTELGFIGTIGAINESLKAVERKMVNGRQDGNTFYLVFGTSKKTLIGKAA